MDSETDPKRALSAAEIYLMNGDGTNPRRLTENSAFDGFPALSPDGTRIVFESTRLLNESEAFNLSDLFVMNADGTEPTTLVRGSSATWSPDGKRIAFHASASGKGQPIKSDPAAATSDNDIFKRNERRPGHLMPHRSCCTGASASADISSCSRSTRMAPQRSSSRFRQASTAFRVGASFGVSDRDRPSSRPC